MRESITAVASIVYLACMLVPAHAEEAEPTDQSASLRVPLGAEIAHYNLAGTQVRVYEQGDKSGNVIVLPWFALQTDASNKVVVSVVEGSGANADKATLTIRLLVVPESSHIKWLLVQRMREEAGSQQTTARKELFSTVTEGKIIPAETKEVAVSEVNYRGPFKFESVSHLDFGGTEIPVSVTVPREAVEETKDEIENGVRWFAVEYSIYAKTVVTESFVEVSHETICKTDALRDIFGDGGAIDPSSLTPALITRKQRLAIKGSILKNIAVTYDIQHPEDLGLLEPQVARYLDALFKEQELLLDQSWSLLSLYGFSKKDIEPDEIKRFVKKLRDKVEEHKENEFAFASSASARYAGFGGSGSLSTSGKWLKDHKEEHELALDIQGDIGIPKGLKVYSLDEAQLQTSGRFASTIRRTVSSLARQILFLSSGPSSVPMNRLATLEARLAGYVTLPIGSIAAWHKSLPNTPALPYGWVECNGQPLNDAAYSDSPYFGQTIPNLNFAAGHTAGRFLRGASTSGELQRGTLHYNRGDGMLPAKNVWVVDGDSGETQNRLVRPYSPAFPDSTVERHYTFSKPVNMTVVWIMRVK